MTIVSFPPHKFARPPYVSHLISWKSINWSKSWNITFLYSMRVRTRMHRHTHTACWSRNRTSCRSDEGRYDRKNLNCQFITSRVQDSKKVFALHCPFNHLINICANDQCLLLKYFIIGRLLCVPFPLSSSCPHALYTTMHLEIVTKYHHFCLTALADWR